MKSPSLWARLVGAQKSGRAAGKENAVGRVPFLYMTPSGKKKAKAATGQPAKTLPVKASQAPKAAIKPAVVSQVSRWEHLRGLDPEVLRRWQMSRAATRNAQADARSVADNSKILAAEIFAASEKAKPGAKVGFAKTPQGEMAAQIVRAAAVSRGEK